MSAYWDFQWGLDGKNSNNWATDRLWFYVWRNNAHTANYISYETYQQGFEKKVYLSTR